MKKPEPAFSLRSKEDNHKEDDSKEDNCEKNNSKKRNQSKCVCRILWKTGRRKRYDRKSKEGMDIFWKENRRYQDDGVIHKTRRICSILCY